MARKRCSVRMVLAAAVLASLVGCSGIQDAAPAAPAVIDQPWPGCDALGTFGNGTDFVANPGSGRVPAGFQPVAAVHCTVREVPGGGGSEVADVERRSNSIDPLLAYSARPSQTSTDPGLACPAVGLARLWLFLLDADGRWISPKLPTDPCGFPLGIFEARPRPYESLSWTDTVIRTRSRR